MPAMSDDVQYSIGVNNRFAGLDDDLEDPFDCLKITTDKELKADKKAKGGKGAKNQERAQQVSKKEVIIEETKRDASKQEKIDKPGRRDRPERSDRGIGRSERGERGGRGRGRGGRGRGRGRGGHDGDQGDDRQMKDDAGFDRPDRGGFGRPERGGFDRSERGGFGRDTAREDGFDGEPRPTGGFGTENPDNADRFGGFRRGRGAPGRGGRGRGFPRGRGRDFDRRSGSNRSSVKPFDKREGSGSFNWGTPQDEYEARSSQEPSNVFLTAEEELKDWVEPTETTETIEEHDEKKEESPQQPQEEVVREMTLDEWKKIQEQERTKVAFNLRKANEGGKPPKDLQMIRKKNEAEEEQENPLFFPKRIFEEKIKTSGRIREHMPLDLKYRELETRLNSGGEGRGRRRGGRRGGSRGGRGRGGGDHEVNGGGVGGRGGMDTSGINLESAEEFPCLS